MKSQTAHLPRSLWQESQFRTAASRSSGWLLCNRATEPRPRCRRCRRREEGREATGPPCPHQPVKHHTAIRYNSHSDPPVLPRPLRRTERPTVLNVHWVPNVTYCQKLDTCLGCRPELFVYSQSAGCSAPVSSDRCS